MDIYQLFDLVAPIAITGGADCMFQPKADLAWVVIRGVPLKEWGRHDCLPPDLTRVMGKADFGRIYWDFARPNYDTLFQQIVAENSPTELEFAYDRWGAKGYKIAGQHHFEFAGDSGGQFPWYETAQLLIERLALITPARELQYA